MTTASEQPAPTAWRQSLRRRLLTWFRRHARELPWRGTRDPYRVWVSEIMLQQTQVATVIPYYERFLEAFPTVADLAAATETTVLRHWEGLGYYRRARQLHAAANVVVSEYQGEFPRDLAAIRALPGIGRYTAGAILSIAFDQRQPIVEANTVRLYSRLLAYDQDPKAAPGERLLWEFAASLLPRKQVGTFNQALMELGSEVCTPRQPACEVCPLAVLCPTQAAGLQDQIPAMRKKAAVTAIRQACVVVRKADHVLLRQCGEDERWAGMWDFPRFDLVSQRGAALQSELREKVLTLTGVQIEPGNRLTTINHSVTRYRIQLTCYQATHRAGSPAANGMRWVRPSELPDYPLNVTARKISQRLVPSDSA